MLVRRAARHYKALTHTSTRSILEHHKMEILKEGLGLNQEKNKRTLKMKLKFLWKETKYTLFQGCRDLWSDTKWIFNLYRTKESY